MGTEHFAQGCLQNVRRRVIAHGGKSGNSVHACRDGLSDGNALAFTDIPVVQIHAFGGLLRTGYGKGKAAARKYADVADLPAALAVERGFVENHRHLFAAFGEVHGFVSGNNRFDSCGTFQIRVPAKFGCRHIFGRVGRAFPCVLPRVFTGISGALALVFHKLAVPLFVHGHIALFQQFLCKVNGEAECVGQFKGVLAAEYGFIGGVDHFFKDLKPRVNGFGEIFLFVGDDLQNEVLFLHQIGVRVGVFLNHRFCNLRQKRAVNAQQSAVARRAAQQTAQNIASALV